jgi:hypothetical protein
MRLAKPGAGLPDIERLVIKYFLVPMVRIFITKKIVDFLLQRELHIIEKLVSKIQIDDRNTSIIIDRTLAIEDDSRRYSINQVLEHLIIAGTMVQTGISYISREKEFNYEIKIENAKAYGDEDMLEKFLEFYKNYFLKTEKLLQKNSKMTKAHPWFVEFNNQDWHKFMYMHTFIHRRQIEAIIKVLGENNE